MIKNIVFDLGNVLVGFMPAHYLSSLGYNDEQIALFDKIVFGEKWGLYDRGDYKNVTELRIALCKRYPKYGKEFCKILKPDWVKMHTLHEDTVGYLYELKSRGYKIYILSNLAADSYEYIKNFDFFKQIDGGVYSYLERVCKPDERLYRILLERYSLNAGETVFLDDREDNIKTAMALGMKGIVFKNFESAKNRLEEILKNENG